MNGIDVLSLLALLVIVGLAFLILRRRFFTVEEGHVAVIHRFDQFRRKAGPGFHFLWPFEEEKQRVYVRRREVKSLPIPNIFTHGGMPLTVNLDFAMQLDVLNMDNHDLYYSEAERNDQIVRTLKGILQALVRNATPAGGSTGDANKVDVASLFSPFLGQQVAAIQKDLETQGRALLVRSGVELLEDSLIISWLGLPSAVISAYTESLAHDFSSASRHKFITRLHNAAPGVSDMGLVQLLNVIEHNPVDIRTIFANGGFDPAMRIQEDGLSLRAPIAGSPPPPPTQATTSAQTYAAPSTASAQPAASQPANDDLPLTEEDMATLRSLFD